MFEAVLTLCMSLAGAPCRDQLLPGYEAPTQAACLEALQAHPPELAAQTGDPTCQPTGPVLHFDEVAPGVFVHMGEIAEPDDANLGDVANIGFVIGADSVAVIDTGSARWIGEGIWRAIRSRTDKPISHVILTHMHPDHVLGASPLVQGGALAVGHVNLNRALADRQANYLESLEQLIGAGSFLGTEAVQIEQTVSQTAEIDLGGRVLDLRAWPMAHTGNDLTVLDRDSGILFTGDLVFHRHTPALDGALLGWQAVLDEMIALGASRIVPGHGGPILPWPVSASDMQRYLKALESDTRAAIASGERLGEAITHIADSEAKQWQLFDAYNPRNATVAFTELEWE